MRNLDFVIKKTAIELGIEEDQVKIVVEGYWKDIADKIGGAKRQTIFVPSVGIFTMSHWKLNHYIMDKIKKMKGMMKSDKFRDESKQDYQIKGRKRLTSLLVYRNILAKEKFERIEKINKKKCEASQR